MDPEEPSSTRRKVKFAPKGPPRRKPKPVLPKSEVADDVDDEATQALLRRVNERVGRREPKSEKSTVHVAFGHGAASSTSIRTYGIPREGNSGKSNDSGLKETASDDGQILFSSPSISVPHGTSGSSLNTKDASSQKKKRDYREPWDYHHTCYPTTLPLRRPYSGNPELLDVAEFGEAAMNLEYDENTTNPASELGLLDQNEEAQMFFLQLPDNLPSVKRSASADGKETADRSKSSGSGGAPAGARGKEIAGIPTSSGGASASASAKGKEMVGSSISWGTGSTSKKGCSLEELPEGYMGKMLVYKSGAIKLKLGNALYDVFPGSDCIFAQDVVAINTNDKDCCVVGELGKRAIVTPDVDSLLNPVINLS